MPVRIRLKRLAYRAAYALLRVRWFLTRPHVTGVKAVLTDGENILLVRHTYGTRSWDFPGGAMKRREDPRTAIRREMDEELGVTPDWQPVGEVSGEMHFRHDTLLCFRAEMTDPALTLDYGELATAQWFPRDNLPAELGRYARRILALLA